MTERAPAPHLDVPVQPVRSTAQRLLAEFVGTAGLLAVVIGSGRQAELLSDDVGVQLLANSLATGAGLTVLIWILIEISGAQFNPAVTIADALQRGLRWGLAGGYLVAQFLGGLAGAVAANLMFGAEAISISTKTRFAPGLWLAEVIATAGLIAVIFLLARAGRRALIAPAVGLYITAAYWFTASTSFANPAVTLARVFSNSFAGIAPGSVLPFLAAQLLGMGLGLGLVWVLAPRPAQD